MSEERKVRGEVGVEPGCLMFILWAIAMFVALAIGDELKSIAGSLKTIAAKAEAKP